MHPRSFVPHEMFLYLVAVAVHHGRQLFRQSQRLEPQIVFEDLLLWRFVEFHTEVSTEAPKKFLSGGLSLVAFDNGQIPNPTSTGLCVYS